MTASLPPLVTAATARADEAGFGISSEPEVGALLAALAAAVQKDGRILEIGTGAGVGLAWIVHGLGQRRDVELVTVDIDASIQRLAREAEWPIRVRFEIGDAAELVEKLGQFHLIFADAPGGKIVKLRCTLNALEPGGILIVDDMDLSRQDDPQFRDALALVRERLLSNDGLVCAELGFASGVILATRRR